MLRPLWTCPRCAARFVVPHSWHSCGRFALDDLFAGAEPTTRELFDPLSALVADCGPVTVVPQKTRVVFMTRVRFINVQVRRSCLIVGFVLAKRTPHSRLDRIETYSPRNHLHLLRVRTPDELDGQVRRWIRSAARVGRQSHLRASGRVTRAASTTPGRGKGRRA